MDEMSTWLHWCINTNWWKINDNVLTISYTYNLVRFLSTVLRHISSKKCMMIWWSSEICVAHNISTFLFFLSLSLLIISFLALLTDLLANSLQKVMPSSPHKSFHLTQVSASLLFLRLSFIPRLISPFFYSVHLPSFILHYKGLNYYPGDAGKEASSASWGRWGGGGAETEKVKPESFYWAEESLWTLMLEFFVLLHLE